MVCGDCKHLDLLQMSCKKDSTMEGTSKEFRSVCHCGKFENVNAPPEEEKTEVKETAGEDQISWMITQLDDMIADLDD